MTTLTYEQFVDRFCVRRQIRVGDRLVPTITGSNKGNAGELRAMLANFMLRRKLVDVMPELPTITFEDLAIEPGAVEPEVFFPLHEQDLANELAAFDEDTAPSLPTARRYHGLTKCENLAKLINFELENGFYEKLVVFAVHRDVIMLLREYLKKWKPVILFGGTSPEKRERNVTLFQGTRSTRIFIGNIQAAGTNISLTAAHDIIFAEMDYVPGNNAQAAARCLGITQTKPVLARVANAGGIDERIQAINRRKTEEVVALFSTQA